MKRFFIFSLIYLILPSLGLAQTISFESDVRYKKLEDAQYSDLKADQNLQLKKGENAFVLPKNGLPVLIYLPIDDSSSLKINEANLQNLVQEQLRTQLNIATNEIVDGVRKVDSLLQKRDYSSALVSITQLKGKYPQVASILFLSASVQYLSNNKAAAIEDLNAGLAVDPLNAAALKLLGELKGSSR